MSGGKLNVLNNYYESPNNRNSYGFHLDTFLL